MNKVNAMRGYNMYDGVINIYKEKGFTFLMR